MNPIEISDFETLRLLFRRPGILPALPTNTMHLIREIDRGAASTGDLEAIVLADPALTAAILRLSNSGEFGGCPGGSLRSAIFLVGYRAIKALAVSSLVKALLRTSDVESLFDPGLFIRHSTFVAYLGRYVAARAERGGAPLGCTPDEVFAAGMLHGLPFILLAHAAPNVFNRLCLWARRHGASLEAAFLELYQRPASSLGAEASLAMGLPPLFAEFMEASNDPSPFGELYFGVCAQRYADDVANEAGWRFESWPVRTETSPEILEAVGLPEVELEIVVAKIAAAVGALDCGARTATLKARL